MVQEFKDIIKGRFTNPVTIVISLIITTVTAFLTNNNFELINSYDYFNSVFEPINSNHYLSCFTACIIMLLASFMLFKLNESASLTLYKSNLPFVFLITFYLANPVLAFISQGLVLLIGMISILFLIFNSYQKSKSAEQTFLSGVILGIVSLLNNNIIFYIPFVIIGFIFMRSFSFKSLLALFLGIISIKWIEFVYFFYNDRLDIFFNKFNIENFIYLTDDIFDFTIINFNLWFSTLIAFISIFISIVTNHIKVKTQLCINVTVFGALTSLLLCYFNYQNIICHQLILYSFLSLLLANIFTQKTTNLSTILFISINAILLGLYTYGLIVY